MLGFKIISSSKYSTLLEKLSLSGIELVRMQKIIDTLLVLNSTLLGELARLNKDEDDDSPLQDE